MPDRPAAKFADVFQAGVDGILDALGTMGGRRGPALIYSNQCAVNLFLQKKILFSRIFELNNYVAERFIDDDEFELNDLIRIRQSVDSIISDYLGGKL